jgi:hypothetical protein
MMQSIEHDFSGKSELKKKQDVFNVTITKIAMNVSTNRRGKIDKLTCILKIENIMER